MHTEEIYEEMLYQNELLRARLVIKEHYANAVMREVYENVGQVLSVLRIQLALLQDGPGSIGPGKLEPSRQLLGRVISDLRNMGRMLQPEENIADSQSLCGFIVQETKAFFPQSSIGGDISFPDPLQKERKLIIMSLVLQVLAMIRQEWGTELSRATITCLTNDIKFRLEYLQAAAEKNKKRQNRSGVSKCLALLGGSITTKKLNDSHKRITLVIPINRRYGKH